jgi:hypothetical protein
MKTKSKTNKQNKAQKNIGSTNIVSETQNRTEQVLSESKTAETETIQTSDFKPQASDQTSLSAGGQTGSVGEGQGEVARSIKPYVNFSERDFNRKLPVEKVLEKLSRWMPKQYQLVEVVGKWIWITFPEPPAETVRADLSQLGFHWNNTRKCWQHPCGETLPRGQQEPRDKYTVWFPRATEALRKKKARVQRDEVPFDRETVAA